jgi:DNA-binding NarL/FixJ family response regulator
MRVVIADDHPHYRRSLGRMLRASGVSVVAEVGDGSSAVRAVSVTGPDVLLLDVYMPGMTCGEAARMVKERSPETAVVMLSVFADEADVVDAVDDGASGFVLKDRPIEEILRALDAAAAGKPIVPSGLGSGLLRRFRDGGAKVSPAVAG